MYSYVYLIASTLTGVQKQSYCIRRQQGVSAVGAAKMNAQAHTKHTDVVPRSCILVLPRAARARKITGNRQDASKPSLPNKQLTGKAYCRWEEGTINTLFPLLPPRGSQQQYLELKFLSSETSLANSARPYKRFRSNPPGFPGSAPCTEHHIPDLPLFRW